MNVFWIVMLVMVLAVAAVVGIFLVTALTGAPYVPTLKTDLSESLKKLYPLGKKDLLIDLGAGDGVILNEAASRGAKALGIELNPILALVIRRRFRKNPKVNVKCRDFYRVKFPPETTVVYAFAVSLRINSIYRKIQDEANRLNKTLYFISNAFDVDEVKPEKAVSTFYLYKITPKS